MPEGVPSSGARWGAVLVVRRTTTKRSTFSGRCGISTRYSTGADRLEMRMAREPAHARLRDYGRLARQRRTRARSSRRHRIVGRMRERERIFAGTGNDTSTDVGEPVERIRRVLDVLRRAPDAFPRAAVRVIRVRILRITPDGGAAWTEQSRYRIRRMAAHHAPFVYRSAPARWVRGGWNTCGKPRMRRMANRSTGVMRFKRGDAMQVTGRPLVVSDRCSD